ncbi:MAG: YpdA family putative bacillithiol disulfide reductase [Rhodothermales bacterium]|nr:YpdA family putative bacillithiol disulfide reductase [Rhodothermales bacterium]
MSTTTSVDVLVVGAGPVGLACAIACKRAGLSARIVEKGGLVNSLIGYPTNMEFFSTPELLEIGDHPFVTSRYKPLREEGLDYYRRVAEAEQLDVLLYTRMLGVDGEAGAFSVSVQSVRSAADGAGRIRAGSVIVATGFFDVPNRLGVEGEDLPKVTHYYKEPYRYAGQRVLVVGAKNSAAKAALQCRRNGALVTMAVRGPAISDRVKYWLRPDLENRIAEGAITAYFNTTVARITPETVVMNTPDGPLEIGNDFVLAMTGYRPDYPFLSALGIETQSDDAMTPVYDAETFQTNRRGVYLAGTVCGGLRTGRWFIENGRFHAAAIVQHITGNTA